MGEQAPSSQGPGSGELELVGQWRARLEFEDGDFAAFGDLEFMYVFNAGGTLTESSNYDAAPPVPPAYGIWRRTGPDRFEAKYEFYPTSAPGGLDEITSGGGWLVAGRGVFTEAITVAAGGDTFTSAILHEAFDVDGNPVEGGGKATGRGVRLRF
jgi:hypothetical protein